MLPAIILAAMVAGALVDVYATEKNTKASDKALNYSSAYINSQFQENERYWRDYYKNTGVRPKYPYRSGAVNDISQLYYNDASKLMNKNARYQSYAGVGTSMAYGYGMGDSAKYHNRKLNLYR